jgi:hypothetical protein
MPTIGVFLVSLTGLSGSRVALGALLPAGDAHLVGRLRGRGRGRGNFMGLQLGIQWYVPLVSIQLGCRGMSPLFCFFFSELHIRIVPL